MFRNDEVSDYFELTLQSHIKTNKELETCLKLYSSHEEKKNMLDYILNAVNENQTIKDKWIQHIASMKMVHDNG